ncbi:MAG TPA: carboxypeptidase regulatory-like domain-containing protein [Candidatus Binatia bacterium]|nr:carboxypeptidase regulatory-like domain-containing protein [Candidatus Binatia bacterium]
MWRYILYPAGFRGPGIIPVFACLTTGLVMPAGAAWGGTIRGTVKFTGGAPVQRKVPVTIDQYVCGKEKDAEELVLSPEKGIRNAVVSLQNPPSGSKLDGSQAPATVMDQKQCVFVPRVVIVPVGGSVQFLNSDRLLHNVKSLSKENPPFNRAQPHARTITMVFKKPEILRVDCDLHSWMHGWVIVVEHPFYAVTNDRGEFTLDGVPPGKYTLQVWQESLGTVTTEVAVDDKTSQPVTVEMGKK